MKADFHLKDAKFEELLSTENNSLEDSLTVWLPKGYRAKYDLLQKKTRKKYTRLLRNQMMSFLDGDFEKFSRLKASDLDSGI